MPIVRSALRLSDANGAHRAGLSSAENGSPLAPIPRGVPDCAMQKMCTRSWRAFRTISISSHGSVSVVVVVRTARSTRAEGEK